jgi:hypothetical protein
MPFGTGKNDIKESSGPKQLILEHWFQKDMVVSYKGQYWGYTYLPYISQKQVKTSTPFQNCS